MRNFSRDEYLQQYKETLLKIPEGAPVYVHRWFHYNLTVSDNRQPNKKGNYYRTFGRLFRNDPRNLRISSDAGQDRLYFTKKGQETMVFGYDIKSGFLIPVVFIADTEPEQYIYDFEGKDKKSKVDIVSGKGEIYDFLVDNKLYDFALSEKRFFEPRVMMKGM